MHTDGPDNFCLQVIGRKRFVLFSPTQWEKMYLPFPKHHGHPRLTLNWSNIGSIFWGKHGEGFAEKLARFPLLRAARPLVMDLFPGDLYYQPAGWGHTVENLDTAVMINFWLKTQMVFSRI